MTLKLEPVHTAPQDPKDMHLVRFEHRYMKNEFLSRQQGRLVQDKRIFVEIIAPGQDKGVTHREASEEDTRRWPNQWNAFITGQEQVVDGTALETCAFLDKGQINMLHSINIRTLEQLADLDDVGLQKIGMGARDLQRTAKHYLLYDIPRSKGAALTADNDRIVERSEILLKKPTFAAEEMIEANRLLEEIDLQSAALDAERTAEETRHNKALAEVKVMFDGLGNVRSQIGEMMEAYHQEKDVEIAVAEENRRTEEDKTEAAAQTT